MNSPVRWSWNEQDHPHIVAAFARDNWPDELEKRASDIVTGKVLCVCAAAAIATDFLATKSAVPESVREVIQLLTSWIDDPSEDRFDRICSIIFDESISLNSFETVWWALRTATSAVGCYEAAWALDTTCERAMESGINTDHIRGVAEMEIMARRQISMEHSQDCPR